MLKAFGRTIGIYRRRQTVQQIADKITYLKLIFTKRKAAVRCSHDCLVFTRRAAVRCACKVARMSQVRPRDNCANFMSCLTVRGVQEQLKHDNRVRVIFIYCLKTYKYWHSQKQLTKTAHKNTLLVYQHIYKTRYNFTDGSSLNRQCVRTISGQKS